MVALVLAAVTGLSIWALTRPAPARMVRFPMPLADDLSFSGTGRPMVAIAPTGDRVAFTAGGGLWLRSLEQMDATLVRGSDGARNPFFAADGQSLGFWADEQFKQVSVSGGAPSRWVRRKTRGEPVGEPTTPFSSVRATVSGGW